MADVTRLPSVSITSWRKFAEALGYSVHERSCHGPGPAYDWGPKSPMQSNHFNSEAAAWADLERTVQRKFEEALRMVKVAQELSS